MTNQHTNTSDEAILGVKPEETPNDGRVAPQDGNRPTFPEGVAETLQHLNLGANNERLEELRPDLVNALRELEAQYRQEGMVARRNEIRRIRQARLFWQGLQYAWWNPQDMTWHLPYESKITNDSASAEMPRYQFVTNLYQAFGLSFISLLSQDVPATRFYPQSAQSIGDITTARAASQVSELVEQNNRVQHLLTGVAFYLWTDGKIGGYVRYVADAQRFGSHDEPVIVEHYVPLGEDAYACPECGAEQEVGSEASDSESGNPDPAGRFSGAELGSGGQEKDEFEDPSYSKPASPNFSVNESPFAGAQDKSVAPNMLPPVLCKKCGAALGPEHFKPAERVAVPLVTGVRRVANG
jgi:hypothetical protein